MWCYNALPLGINWSNVPQIWNLFQSINRYFLSRYIRKFHFVTEKATINNTNLIALILRAIHRVNEKLRGVIFNSFAIKINTIFKHLDLD